MAMIDVVRLFAGVMSVKHLLTVASKVLMPSVERPVQEQQQRLGRWQNAALDLWQVLSAQLALYRAEWLVLYYATREGKHLHVDWLEQADHHQRDEFH